MKISETIAALERLKASCGDVEVLCAPIAQEGDRQFFMPAPINDVQAWWVNQGYALLMPAKTLPLRPIENAPPLPLREQCVRWLRRKRVTAELSTAELRKKAKEFETQIGADAEQMLKDAEEPGSIEGYPHSALAHIGD